MLSHMDTDKVCTVNCCSYRYDVSDLVAYLKERVRLPFIFIVTSVFG